MSVLSNQTEVLFLDARMPPGTEAFATARFTLPPLATQIGGAATSNYSYTGAFQTFVVPTGVTSIDVTLSGAGASSAGGLVAGTLAVTPEETLNIVVGGAGTEGGGPTFGRGGSAGGSLAQSGGGRTAIQRGQNDIVVAGGAGGYGIAVYNNPPSQTLGGVGGGLNGGDGNFSVGFSLVTSAATGGTQFGGGGGGGTYNATGEGSSGQIQTGGSGGQYNSSGGGGGGGGGYYGGGGGAYGLDTYDYYDDSGGGGGGSALVANLTGTVVNSQGGGSTSNGSMSISYNSLITTFPTTGRHLTIKDPYGAFSTRTVLLSTSLLESFENGLTTMEFSTNFTSLQLYGASNRWYTIQSNTAGGFNTSTLSINCNVPRFVLDVNSIANVSSLNYAIVPPPTSNMWVAVGNDNVQNNSIKYSFDGITWSNSLGSGLGSGGYSVAFNGSMWVATGQETNSIRYSYNGINWSNAIGGFGGATIIGHNVAWGRDRWVAVGTGTSNILHSSDGISWAAASNVFSSEGYGVAWNGNLWVAVGSDSTSNNRIKYSFNGINWLNSASGAFTTSGLRVAANSHMWVATGVDSTQNNRIKYSYDGINWLNSVGTGFTSEGYGIAWNGRLWVAVGADSTPNNTIKYSFDGITWLNSAGPGFTTQGSGVAWNGQQWVAVGFDSTQNNRLKYSFNGINWSNSAGTGFGNWAWGVAFSSNQVTSYQQTNLAFLPQNIPAPLVSTNTFFFTPSSLTLNNTLVVDAVNRNIGIRTFSPDPLFLVDVNGPARGAVFYSTITAGGTFTISPGSNFGVFYNITTNGTYTVSLPATQALSNIGKFFVLRNNTGSSLSLTIAGGSGIASPYTLATGTSMTVTVNTRNSYTTL